MTINHPHQFASSSNPQACECLLSIAKVEAITSLSSPTLYAKMLKGEFPRPIKLGGPETRRVAWTLSSVSAWVDSRIAASQV
jgi:prophage regulatory protein